MSSLDIRKKIDNALGEHKQQISELKVAYKQILENVNGIKDDLLNNDYFVNNNIHIPTDEEVIAELKKIAQNHDQMESAVNALSNILPLNDEMSLYAAQTLIQHVNDNPEDEEEESEVSDLSNDEGDEIDSALRNYFKWHEIEQEDAEKIVKYFEKQKQEDAENIVLDETDILPNGCICGLYNQETWPSGTQCIIEEYMPSTKEYVVKISANTEDILIVSSGDVKEIEETEIFPNGCICMMYDREDENDAESGEWRQCKIENYLSSSKEYIVIITSTNEKKIVEAKDVVKIDSNNVHETIEFVPPQKNDYQHCAMKFHKTSECPVIKRIIHFLQIYERQQNMQNSVSMYDYMLSLKGYDISQLSEDWYQAKMHHLFIENDVDFLNVIVNKDCDGNNNCKYVRRYQRDREKDRFDANGKDFDPRNFILMDQMDSIHSFLFHSMQRRHTFVPFGDVIDDEKKQQIVLPQSLIEFSVEQIVYVLNTHIFDKLKPKNQRMLQQYQNKIIDFIERIKFNGNELNGNELKKMGRKQFIILLAAHLEDRKLTIPLSALYKDLMAYQATSTKANVNVNVIISSKSKFITEEKTKDEYFSFGEKYIYNPQLSNSELYVKAKYTSIKEELFEYFARTSTNKDATELVEKQMKIIDSTMKKRLRPLLKEFVNEQPITSSNVLWNKDIETSRKQLKEIIAKLCEHADVSDDDEFDENSSNVAMESMDIAFKVYAINKIQNAIKMNKERYINQPRVNVFIEKCKSKMKVESVKKMQAAKHKNSKDYGIRRYDPISFEHVLALILYSQCTKLCTAFRFTYRRLENESTEEYKKRHSLYAHMGRLLFECFLFFASTKSKVSVLYHGMGIELLFKNLECKFVAPTSTTTEESVACSFGSQGVVMKLESAGSNKFIKSVDMSLFSCFDNECEHFIFDYKLRIINLFIPRIRCWIGNSIMNRLLLLDLLSNNFFVDNEQFLKEKNQNGLIKILRSIVDGTISTFTKYKYVNAFIESLITQSEGIKFNMKNKRLLISDLRSLFIDKNNKNSPFEIEYQNKALSICKLRKQNEQNVEPATRQIVESKTSAVSTSVVTAAVKKQEVAEKKLLVEWGLGMYWDIMKDDGWDDSADWKDITDDDFEDMNFKSEHIKIFRSKINAENEAEDELIEEKLLNEWGLGKFWDAMKSNGWTDLNNWGDITDDEFKAMKFKRGHIRKFKRRVEEEKNKAYFSPAASPGPQSPKS